MSEEEFERTERLKAEQPNIEPETVQLSEDVIPLDESLPPTVLSAQNSVVSDSSSQTSNQPDFETIQPGADVSSSSMSKEEKLDETIALAPLKSISTDTQPAELKTLQAQPNVPPKLPPVSPENPPKRKRRWPWVLVAVLILFLGTIGGVVPVENIPILRNIAHAMGFTPEEAKQMSFLRALLTWTDKTLGLNGRLSAGPSLKREDSLFSPLSGNGAAAADSENTPSLQGQMARYKTSLFDVRTLNELQRQKGLPAEQIAGSVLLAPGEKADIRAKMRDADVTVNTDANNTTHDVYFGSDLAAFDRKISGGYDSVKTLTKVKNPHIADGQPMDWLLQATSRMMKADAGLVGMDKELNNSVLGWQTNVEKVGDTQPQRELYYAWITNRMAKYTANHMLKKKLADVGFLGGEIPTHASNSLTYGGIRIDLDALNNDQEGWKKYQEFERKCKEELTDGGGKEVKEAVNSFNSKFSSWTQPIEGYSQRPPENFGFPMNCGEFNKFNRESYRTNLSQIRDDCKKATKGYQRLYEYCDMAVDWDKPCDDGFITTYTKRWDNFEKYCKEYCDNEAAKDTTGTFDIEKCKTETQPAINEWNGEKAEDTEKELLAVVGGKTDYFPQIVKGQEVSPGNVVINKEDKTNLQNTIKAGVYRF